MKTNDLAATLVTPARAQPQKKVVLRVAAAPPAGHRLAEFRQWHRRRPTTPESRPKGLSVS